MPQRTHLTARPDYDSFVFHLAHGGVGPLDRHEHGEIEANIVTAGTGTCVVRDGRGGDIGSGRDRRIELAPGRILLLGIGIDHALVRSSGDFSMWVCWWRRHPVAQLDAELGITPLVDAHWSVLEPGRQDLRHLEGLLSLAATCASNGKPLRLDALMREAWCRIRTSTTDRRSGLCSGDNLHPAVARALAELSAHPDIALPALAVRCGLSCNRLSSTFVAAMGCTIARWRIGIRLDRLVGSFDPRRHRLTDAALTAGFGSYARFHAAFVSRYGCAPRTWFAGRIPDGS